jgi:hypothetical protein
MNPIHLAASLALGLVSVTSHAQTAGTEPWGKPPTASDDRFRNPKSKVYAGPDGWWDTGEVRASVGATSYGFKGTFREMSGSPIAVKDLQTIYFNFGDGQKPKPGVYKVAANGSAARNTVAISFADVGNQQIKEWKSADGAGSLTVSLVNGFIHYKARNLTLQPSGPHNSGELKKPMTLGFEGAMKAD